MKMVDVVVYLTTTCRRRRTSERQWVHAPFADIMPMVEPLSESASRLTYDGNTVSIKHHRRLADNYRNEQYETFVKKEIRSQQASSIPSADIGSTHMKVGANFFLSMAETHTSC